MNYLIYLKTIIVIPAYNDNKHISTLINKLSECTDLPLLIIDDGSDEKLELDKSIYVIRNKENQGKGYSLLKGFKHAYSSGFTHAITIDADLQHDPQYISDFIETDEIYDIVIGKNKKDVVFVIQYKRLFMRVLNKLLKSIKL